MAENYEIKRNKVFHRKKNTTSIVKRGAREIRKCHNSQFGSWLVASETRFKKVPRSGGRTRDLFDFRLFSLTSSTLDHSATAPPTSETRYPQFKSRRHQNSFQHLSTRLLWKWGKEEKTAVIGQNSTQDSLNLTIEVPWTPLLFFKLVTLTCFVTLINCFFVISPDYMFLCFLLNRLRLGSTYTRI